MIIVLMLMDEFAQTSFIASGFFFASRGRHDSKSRALHEVSERRARRSLSSRQEPPLGLCRLLLDSTDRHQSRAEPTHVHFCAPARTASSSVFMVDSQRLPYSRLSPGMGTAGVSNTWAAWADCAGVLRVERGAVFGAGVTGAGAAAGVASGAEAV